MTDTKSQEKNQKSNSDSLPDESITIEKKEKIYDESNVEEWMELNIPTLLKDIEEGLKG